MTPDDKERPGRRPTPAGSKAIADAAVEGSRRSPFADLRRRARLTIQYHGWRTLLFRIVTFPLRFTPLRDRLRLRSQAGDADRRARERLVPRPRQACRRRDPELPRLRARGDARGEHPPHGAGGDGKDHRRGRRERSRAPRRSARDRRDRGDSGRGEPGFAANVNRGLRATDPSRDVVLLNSDTEAQPEWLACLQYASGREDDIGCGGRPPALPRRAHPVRGTVRNLGAPGVVRPPLPLQAPRLGTGVQASAALALTGACMYMRREALERVGLLDERYPMAYEDVDWCLRAWQAGFRMLYFPAARPLPPRVGHARNGRGRARARVPAAVLGALGRVLRRARRAHAGRQAARRLRHRGHGRGRRPPRRVRAPQPAARPRPRGLPLHARDRARLVRAARAGAQLRGLRGARGGALGDGRHQGRDVVEHRRTRVAGECAARHPRVLRAGHRDELLPRRRASPATP